MIELPTPETDAAQHEGLLRTNPIPTQVVHVNFARKLERERDMLRTALEDIYNLCHVTCLSFEEHSFEATKIAGSALAKLKEGGAK